MTLTDWETIPGPTPDEAVTAAVEAAKSLAIELPTRDHIDPDDVEVEVLPPDDAGGYMEPWGRLPEESDKAWGFFREYRDMGQSRTVVAIAEKSDIGSDSMRNHYSGRFRWADRARAYDLHLDRMYRLELEDAVREMAGRHAKVMVDGMEVLTAPFEALRRRMKDPDFWDDLSSGSISRLIDLAQKSGRVIPTMMNTERLARGLPTDIKRIEGEVQHEHIHQLDPERLGEIVDALQGAGALDGRGSTDEPGEVADTKDD